MRRWYIHPLCQTQSQHTITRLTSRRTLLQGRTWTVQRWPTGEAFCIQTYSHNTTHNQHANTLTHTYNKQTCGYDRKMIWPRGTTQSTQAFPVSIFDVQTRNYNMIFLGIGLDGWPRLLIEVTAFSTETLLLLLFHSPRRLGVSSR